jgi:hypothetical protein
MVYSQVPLQMPEQHWPFVLQIVPIVAHAV